MINKNGDYIIEPHYTFIGVFVDECAWVQSGSEYGFINNKGKELTPLAFSYVGDFREGVAYAKEKNKNGLYGYIDTTGKYAIEPKFEKAGYFIDGIAIVKSNKKYGIIDKSGNFVIEPIYDGIAEWDSFCIYDDKHNLINLKPDWTIIIRKKKCGILDRSLNIVLEPQFDIIDNEIHDGMIDLYDIYKDENNTETYRHGFISEDGKTLIPPIYDFATSFENGISKVRLGSGKGCKYGCIDKKGNWLNSLTGL